jgi:TM2 domain-containing membrane protein YozV
MLARFFLPVLLLISIGLSADPRPPSGIPEIDSLPLNDWKAQSHPLSTFKAVSLSAVFPGGGQFYGGHPVRGSFLVGLESVLFGLSLYTYLVDLPRLDRVTSDYLDSANSAFDRMMRLTPDQRASSVDKSTFEISIQRARNNASLRLQKADLANSQLAWAIGLHFYGMADALEIARKSQNPDPKSRSIEKAMWCGLAFPGGAQLYNERYGKFGMLWMALGASAVSAWSRQNVVESLNLSIASARAEEGTGGIATDVEQLDVDRTLYRKRRNQYYWGMALLYVYGVLDGMVDAALSDFDKPNRYALEPGSTPLSAVAVVHF